jgi:SAM-dependent methyltransferase
MTMCISDKWDLRYKDRLPLDQHACEVLQDYVHLLPDGGRALDLASGLGGNAIFLAQQGLNTVAWDISRLAIKKLNCFALKKGLSLKAVVRDIEKNPPAKDTFDVIVVSYFLYRKVLPLLSVALRPNGVLFYQTFTIERPVDNPGPSNPDFLLQPNELLKHFSGMKVLAYREDSISGDLTQGQRGIASLVAQRSA